MSELLEWERARHSTWIDEMDGQHRAIVSLMDALFQRDAARASKAELSKMLDLLREQTARHFKEEEAYMAATGYSKLDIHQVIHRDLLLKLDEHVHRFQVGGERLGAGLSSFLKFWLSAHVTGADRGQHRQRPGEREWRLSPDEAATKTGVRPAPAGELR